MMQTGEIYNLEISIRNQQMRLYFDVNEYMKVHDTNLLGAILVLKYAFPLLKKAKGKVVIVNSFAARTYSKLSGFE